MAWGVLVTDFLEVSRIENYKGGPSQSFPDLCVTSPGSELSECSLASHSTSFSSPMAMVAEVEAGPPWVKE